MKPADTSGLLFFIGSGRAFSLPECFAKCCPDLIDENLARVDHSGHRGKTMDHAWPAGVIYRNIRGFQFWAYSFPSSRRGSRSAVVIRAGATSVKSVAKSGDTFGSSRFIHAADRCRIARPSIRVKRDKHQFPILPMKAWTS